MRLHDLWLGNLGLGGMLLLLSIVPVLFIYLLPGIAASYRRHPHQTGIWLLTVFGGWTGLGWFAALVWAFVLPSSGPGEATGEAGAPAPAADTNRWAFFLHLSLLAGHVVPLAGFVAPIVIWQTKKEDLPGLDVHGRNAANWILSEILYAGCGLALILALVGLPLLVALSIAALVFPIVAAIKAIDGRVWRYPLAIPFFN